MKDRTWTRVPAPFALPIGATTLLVVGAVAAQLHGRFSAIAVTSTCGLVVVAITAVSERTTALPMAGLGWMVASAFSRSPYGQLQPSTHEAATAAVVMSAGAAIGIALGAVGSWATTTSSGVTLDSVSGFSGLAAAVDRRRQIYAVALGLALLPLLTIVLTATRADLTLADDLLLYLLAVVAVAVVGGFWPAIAAATAASLLLNWYFTAPFHTFTIAEPDNLLALLLFVLVAIAVSSVVHLAARRSQQARRSRAEAETLLRLARTVLAGDDTPTAVLHQLQRMIGGAVELKERTGSSWTRLAAAGDLSVEPSTTIALRGDLSLVVHGPMTRDQRPLIEAAAGQAAGALDRDRLRTQAAQSEALAAGNRMRTALLAAVSHDLRTPLASIKAGISSLRQTDITWSSSDEAELLATIEEETDRLDALIGNLLDMSRLQTGALQPYLQPTGIDGIAPLALRGIAGAQHVRVDVPENLPLVRTDPGLLERALGNLLSNAARYSPVDRPPELVATSSGGHVRVAVVDHGPGVSAAERERMFEPFQRLGDQDSTTGVGLGLAVARGFIEVLGGRVDASDTAGGGLTMTVELPVAAREDNAQPVER